MDLISVPIELTESSFRVLDYQVKADMDNDGIFEVDIKQWVMSIDTIDKTLEFKKTGDIIGRPCADIATLTLDNSTGYFSPNNSSNIESDYPGTFRNNTKIQILAGFIDNTGTSKTRELFVGVITKFGGKYNSGDNKMVIEMEDLSKFAKRKKVPNHSLSGGTYYEAVLFDTSISEAIDYLVDFCYGTTFVRNIQNIPDKLPVIEFQLNETIWSALQKLCEGANGRMWFDGSEFNFESPLSPDYSESLISAYTFTTDHVFNFSESVDEKNIINKWKITSNAKTLQPRSILHGTPSQSIITSVDNYFTGDGKGALAVDNKTFTLKTQLPDLSWVASWNVPLVDCQTYIDLGGSPTAEQIAAMNAASTVKVWDKLTNTQLTVNDFDVETGEIELLNTVNPADYNIQIIFQYYNDRIMYGKSKWYEFQLEKSSRFIESPLIVANDGTDQVTVSSTVSTNNLYLSDWTIYDGNSRVKFKLTNNVPIVGAKNKVYITKMESWGNTLECVNALTFTAIDGTTIDDFENSQEITNDYILDIEFGQQLVDNFLHKYKNNLTFLDTSVKGMPQVDLLDRVTITESKSGINFDFLIIGIKHNITVNGWKTNLTLQSTVSPWSYDPSRVTSYSSYNRNGESYINRNNNLTATNPSNMVLSETTFVSNSGDVVSELTVTLDVLQSLYYANTVIQYSSDAGVTYYDGGLISNGKCKIRNLEIGTTYTIKAYTVLTNNTVSTGITDTITLNGITANPTLVASTAPTVITGIKQLSLSFVGISDTNILDYYEIQRSSDDADWNNLTKIYEVPSSLSWSAWSTVGTSASPTYIDTDVAYNKVYRYKYRAKDTSGNYSSYSSESSPTAGTTQGIPSQTTTTDLTQNIVNVLSENVIFDLPYYFKRNTKIINYCEGSFTANSWSGVVGSSTTNTTNFKTGTASTSITTANDGGGAYVAGAINLTLFTDGSTSGADDYICFCIYISSGELTKVGTGIRLRFFCNAAPTTTDRFVYSIAKASLSAGWNFFKVAKSTFTTFNSANWANVVGYDLTFEGAPSSSATFSVDTLQLVRKDPISTAPNPFQVLINNVWTRIMAIGSGHWFVGRETSSRKQIICRNLNTSNDVDSLLGNYPFSGNWQIDGFTTCKVAGAIGGYAWYIDANNYVRSYVDSNTLYLEKVEGGSATSVNTSITVVADDTAQFKVIRQGSTISVMVYLNGVNYIPYFVTIETSLSMTTNGYLAVVSTSAKEFNLDHTAISRGTYTSDSGIARILNDSLFKQGGSATTSAGTVTVTFDTAFPSTNYIILATITSSVQTTFNISKTTTGFTFTTGIAIVSFDWLAILL